MSRAERGSRAAKPPKHQLERALRFEAARPDEGRDERILKMIRSIPKGKVASYSQVAAAAGYPLLHRLVAKLLRQHGSRLPWQRVLGAGGVIRLQREAALEQRLRLEMEGVRFKGARVDWAAHQHVFRPWDE